MAQVHRLRIAMNDSEIGFYVFISHPAWMAIFGAMVGSFINVVAHRVGSPDWAESRRERGLVRSLGGESACPCCGHRIRAWENVPVLSWLALRGRCSGCGQAIPVEYLATELAMASAWALLAVLLPAGATWGPWGPAVAWSILYAWTLSRVVAGSGLWRSEKKSAE